MGCVPREALRQFCKPAQCVQLSFRRNRGSVPYTIVIWPQLRNFFPHGAAVVGGGGPLQGRVGFGVETSILGSSIRRTLCVAFFMWKEIPTERHTVHRERDKSLRSVS